MADEEISREDVIERLSNALWHTSDEKLAVIAAVIDL